MRKVLVASIAVAATLLMAAPVQAATVQTVEFKGRYAAKDRKKARGGLSLRTIINVRDDAGALAPLRLSHTTLRFPKGAVVNARHFPRCNVAALTVRGTKACPKGSRLGTGKARGAAPPFVNVVNAKVWLFNGKLAGRNPTLLIYSVPDIGPVLTLRAVMRKNRGPYGYVLDLDVPPIRTLPGQPNAAVTFFDATVRDLKVRRKGRTIHYIDAPVLCTGTYFLLDGAFSYQGGVTNSVLERFTLNGGPRCP
jgi:hypothetical protein